MELNEDSLKSEGITEDFVSFDGSEVKALGNGKVAGYLVTFGDENNTDISEMKDFFQSDTNFGRAKTSDVLYHHGLDTKVGGKVIGEGSMKMDNVGVWIEAQLDMADEYEKAIYKLVEKRKLGWSSGTASHRVTRKKVGNANKILTWPLGLDASLTPMPAEPRNRAISLKSITVKDIWSEAGEATESKTSQTTNNNKGNTMEETQEQKAAREALEAEANRKALESAPDMFSNIVGKVQQEFEQENALKAAKAKQQEQMEEGIKDLVRAAMKSEPANNKGGSAYLNLNTKRGDDAMKAFEYYLRTGDEKAIKTTYYLNESVDEEGMATVPKDFYNQVVTKLSLQSFPRNIGARSITTSSRAIDIPIQNTQWAAPASTAESQTSTQTAASVNTVQPFDTLTVTPVKYTRIVLLSDEYLADDKANVTSMITDTLSDQFGVLENALAVTEITAGVTANFEAAAATAIAAADINSLYFTVTQPYRNSRSTAWVMEGSTEGAIRGLTGNPFLFAQTPQGNISPEGAGDPLMGRPVYNAATVSTIAASAKTVWFGNFNYLAMVTNGGFSVRRLNELYAASGQVAFLFSERIAFKTLQPEAFAYLIHPSA